MMLLLYQKEEIIKQKVFLGKDKITAVKTYENGNFVEEIILSKKKITDPTPKIIDLGTSEFFSKTSCSHWWYYVLYW